MNGLDLTEWLEGDELVSSAWVKDVLEKADRAPDFRNPILAFTVSLKAISLNASLPMLTVELLGGISTAQTPRSLRRNLNEVSQFQRSVASSQHITFVSLCDAYDRFIGGMVKIACHNKNIDTYGVGDFATVFEMCFGKAACQACWLCDEIHFILSVRDALVYRGGTFSPANLKIVHDIVIEDDVLKIRSQDNAYLATCLGEATYNLIEFVSRGE